jgi:hypothetical protein
MLRSLLTVVALTSCTAFASCSLLFEAAEEKEVDVVLSRELVSTIGVDHDFATLAEWLLLRRGDLTQRQVMRVKNFGAIPGREHFLQGERCEGLLHPVRADAALSQLLILDLSDGSDDCVAGDILEGTGNVQLEVIEALPRGTSELLRFETTPIIGPLRTDDELVTSEEFRLTLEAGPPPQRRFRSRHRHCEPSRGRCSWIARRYRLHASSRVRDSELD